jgi:voltage-gated potassium channel
MRTPRTLLRAIDRFLEDPASIRTAAWLIVGATVTAVVAGGVVVRLLDHREYPNLGRALWFTLQTVTTVGYGDVTPTRAVGRLVAAVVMVIGIGFITVVTAAVTSVFVEASRQRSAKTADPADSRLAADSSADLATVNARLDQIEETLALLVEQTRPR